MLDDFINDAYSCAENTLDFKLQELVKTILKVLQNDSVSNHPQYKQLESCLDERGDISYDDMDWECLDYWLEKYVMSEIISNHPAARAIRVIHEIDLHAVFDPLWNDMIRARNEYTKLVEADKKNDQP